MDIPPQAHGCPSGRDARAPDRSDSRLLFGPPRAGPMQSLATLQEPLMSADEHHDEYGETFVAGLEWMWGEGFLSPGGEAEVARIIAGAPIEGARVLDVGCGLGAVDVLLVARFGAGHVTGIDVEAPLVARRRRPRVEAAGLADRDLDSQGVAQAPSRSRTVRSTWCSARTRWSTFPDKRALYRGHPPRARAPGGWMVLSDWFGNGREPTPAMREWLDVVGLTLRPESIEASAALVEACGFAGVEWRRSQRLVCRGSSRTSSRP